MQKTSNPPFNFYDGKRCFVTGHTGLKAAWLALWLKKLGAQVRGFALQPTTSPASFDQLGLQQLIEHEVGDVTHMGHVLRAQGILATDGYASRQTAT
jgi:CDP-glucose 4,6-dehydratase